MKKIFIFGSGEYFIEQYYWLKDFIKSNQNKYLIEALVDDLSNENYDKHSKIKIIKQKQIPNNENTCLYLAIGTPDIRKKILDKFKNYNFLTLIHPSSVVSEGSTLGKGCTVSPGTIIAGNAKIGDFNNFNLGSMIAANCVMGFNNTLSPGTKIMGNCKIGDCNFFGVDSIMIPGKEIKNNNMVGANSTITKNFDSNYRIVGSPAKSRQK